MTKIGHIAWKEFRGYFTSWMAYALLAGWLLIAGYVWMLLLSSPLAATQFQPAVVYSNLIIILLFITPLLTMRLLAEERSSGTIEMLFTAPISEWQVTLGKFLGAWAFTLAMLALTLYIPLFALRYGDIDTGPLWGSYLALTCLSAASVAFGLFCSSLTASLVVAGFLAFGGLILSWMLAGIESSNQGSEVAAFIAQWSIFAHLAPMLNGAVHLRDLIYFASLIVFFLFATVRVLESRKWRGV